MNANKKTPLDYAMDLGQYSLVTYISQQLQGEDIVEQAFLSASKKGQWESAKAIDNERAMVMQLDEQFSGQLAWYSFDNSDVKARLMQEAVVQAEKVPCDKARLYQTLAHSKTATYRQLRFWATEQTKTTTLCEERADNLEEHRSIRQNVDTAF